MATDVGGHRLACGGALLILVLLSACGEDEQPVNCPAEEPVRTWACPEGWVAYARGGCGPAVLLCTPDGGAAPDACAPGASSRPAMIARPDGGAVRGLHRLPDGRIGGAWPEPGDPDGPPREDWAPDVPDLAWSPDAGIATCPTRWQRRADGTCEPALAACPDGSGALPGGVCTPTAQTDCPPGDYADVSAETVGRAVVHVHAGRFTTPADGTIERPFATLTEALAHTRDGDWVLVARGEYNERLVVNAGATVHVVGACAAQVTLRGPGPAGAIGASVAISGAGTTLDLRNITIRGDGRGIQVASGANLRASGLIVASAAEVGLLATGSGTRAEIASSVVRDTRPAASGTALGFGIAGSAGAFVRATEVFLAGNVGAGVLAQDAGTRVELAASVVRDTRGHGDDRGGYGLHANVGASLRATEVLVEQNREYGVFAEGQGTRVDLASCVVRGTLSRADAGTGGWGVLAQSGAGLYTSNTQVEDNRELGVSVVGPNTTAEFVTSVVQGTRPRVESGVGRGVQLSDAASLHATGLVVAENTGSGLIAFGVGTDVELVASVVRGTRPLRDGTVGRGVEANGGAVLRATGLLVADNHEAGVYSTGDETRVELVTGVVRDTRRVGDAAGLRADLGARLDARGVQIAQNDDIGVLVNGSGTTGTVAGCVVRGTRPRAKSSGEPTTGHGVEAVMAATLRVADTLIVDNTELGAVASDERTLVELAACVVRGTRFIANRFGSAGVEAQRRATLRATRTLIAGNAEAGVRAISPETRVELTSSVVRDTVPHEAGAQGFGLSAALGATVRATGTLIERNTEVGVIASGEGTLVELVGSAVRGTRSRRDMTFGRGVEANAGAMVSMTGALLEEDREVALFVHGQNTRLVATDTLVMNVLQSRRDFGVGLFVAAGASADVRRMALQQLAGAGVIATSGGVGASRAFLEDLFVRDVRTSSVRFNEDAGTFAPEGEAVAYGLHTGDEGLVAATRFVLDRGQVGVFNAGGTMSLRQGVITNQSEGAGAFRDGTPPDATTLGGVSLRENGPTCGGAGITRRSLTPASVPRPTDSCGGGGC